MLILSRFVGESLVIAHPLGDITVMVTSIDKGRCRLGVSAPRCVAVDRSEIHTAKMDAIARAEIGGEGGGP